jgi:NADP-dependent 3-hydroxy acid dehydrogenase YdfG
VLATARRADLLDELTRECDEQIEVMPGDITDASHLGSAVDAAV